MLLIPYRSMNVSRFLKLAVDGLQDLSIIRPTSGADETENFLLIKQLDEVSGAECFGSKVESTAVDRKSVV